MTALDPILQACRVRKVFGAGIVALDDVDLDIYPGDWLAVTGTSGSGKTTLLQLFAALDTPTSGQIRYQGIDLADLDNLDSYRRRSIGIVFQLHNLLPHLNVRDNIEVAMLGAHLTGQERIARVSERVAQVGLQEQQLRKPPELSGGERQRAAIARALANSPDVLLADEPTGSLDPDHVTRLVGLLRDLNRKQQTTIVMVTHDPAVAAQASRTVTLNAGKLTETTPAHTLKLRRQLRTQDGESAAPAESPRERSGP
jgi:putative ABC transport system ATP-binding protein